jgi:hypothetical protein
VVTSHDEKLGERRMTMLGSISCGGLAGILFKGIHSAAKKEKDY